MFIVDILSFFSVILCLIYAFLSFLLFSLL